MELGGGSSRREVVTQSIEPVVPVVGERGKKLLGELDRCGPQAVAGSPALARLGGLAARSGGVAGRSVGRAARMARRVGSARATKTCSATASMSGVIEMFHQFGQLPRPAVAVRFVRLAAPATPRGAGGQRHGPL